MCIDYVPVVWTALRLFLSELVEEDSFLCLLFTKYWKCSLWRREGYEIHKIVFVYVNVFKILNSDTFISFINGEKSWSMYF